MNRQCHGSWFLIEERLHYRCFYDGTIVDATGMNPAHGEVCPNCKRRTLPTPEVPKEAKTRVIREVLVNETWTALNVKGEEGAAEQPPARTGAMTLPGKITILFDHEGMDIQVCDSASSVEFLEIRLNQENACQALSRMAHTPAPWKSGDCIG